ncbi:hypothetical protein MUK42_37127 [Musa troglodytarum]|uniref:RNA-binding protein Tab2-like N-terminal domain-containing protein n=1 Tax=Musa troglodytarum TaxID=320322 RepID=A0A9E7GAG8_9LILI|nr:hypothetical protein MUK42_37127 [Musa troglodytarum]
MATLGLNCYSSSIRVARRQPAPLPASSLHPLSKAPYFPRSFLPPSATTPERGGPGSRRHPPPSQLTSTAADDEEDLQEEAVDPTAELRSLDPAVDPGSIREWEVDFCSRPILDDRGKKLWELVVCDRTLSLQFTRFFPNNVINSVTLKDAIASISDMLGVPLPEKIRFFRSQMQTIITRACNELGIKPIPSKRAESTSSSNESVLKVALDHGSWGSTEASARGKIPASARVG